MMQSLLCFSLAVGALALAQAPRDVTTNVQLENLVFYMDQHGDATKIGSLPGPAPLDPQLGFALRRYAIIADITSIGGKPAAGTFLAHGVAIAPSNAPQPVPGTTITDLPRNQMHNVILDIMTPEKAQVGSLYGTWMGAGGSAPGAPAGAGVLAVLGGSGAFVGARGQGSNIGSSNLRTASMQEDPSRRRVNGGGRLNLGIHLAGLPVAEVASVSHADFAPVSASRPARSGDVLTLQVQANWAVRPALSAGQTFSDDPPHAVAIPVEVLLNDSAVEVVNLIGWPGTRDRYRVDIRMPGGLATGMAKLQVNGAYLPGVETRIPVQ